MNATDLLSRSHKMLSSLFLDYTLDIEDSKELLILLKNIEYFNKSLRPNLFCQQWYTSKEIYHYLISHNYSEEISKELSKRWVIDCQLAHNKDQLIIKDLPILK